MHAVDLSHHDFIHVGGTDSVSFLQGQVSCDMNQLGEDNSLRGALCNLKGRVVADFRVLRRGDGCLLQSAPGMGRKIIDVLAKYAVFSKVELRQESDIHTVIGVIGDDAGPALKPYFPPLPDTANAVVAGEGALAIRHGGSPARYEIWCQAGAAAERLLAGPAAEPADWDQEDFLAGIIHIDAGKSEQYTPQLLNYDRSGVINFKKGCYTGQEIVARMYYRAQAKKRLYLLRSTHPLHVDLPVVQRWQDRQSRADILAVANGAVIAPNRHLALAVLQTEGVENNATVVVEQEKGKEEQALELLPLPYGAVTSE